MSDGKKTRMAMLDNLAGSPAPLAMKSASRPLRAARDAVDAQRVWELDPDQIEDERVADRLNQKDVDDLRASIEISGQTVPILVRRHPTEEDKYLLVYGRRRLEAIRSSDDVDTVKALIANLDDEAALGAQISENMGRRDLSFIEKALFAKDLVDGGYGKQTKVAEVLDVTKSWMSMALKIVETVTPEIIRAIGAAPGVGRPRWERFADAITRSGYDKTTLFLDATSERGLAAKMVGSEERREISDAVFEALFAKVTEDIAKPKAPATSQYKSREFSFDGSKVAALSRVGKKVRLELEPGEFADFVETEAEHLLKEMQRYWQAELDKKPKD